MPSTPEILDIEKKLSEHRKVPATNAFTEIGWSNKYGDLMSEYKMALARAGYKTLEERKLELEEQKKWRRLFSKHPVEPIPSKVETPE